VGTINGTLPTWEPLRQEEPFTVNPGTLTDCFVKISQFLTRQIRPHNARAGAIQYQTKKGPDGKVRPFWVLEQRHDWHCRLMVLPHHFLFGLVTMGGHTTNKKSTFYPAACSAKGALHCC